MRSLMAELGLMHRVRFTGLLSVDDLARCLARSHVGVALYTGRAEYTGMKLLDYKAAGLASLVTGEGGEPSLIRHGVTGIIVPPNDVAAVVHGFETLLDHEDLRCSMGQQARVEAELRHGWEHTAQALVGVLHRVVTQAQVYVRDPKAG
jgi:glycosyltransferase involved in cell wall biosynthesis